MISRKPISLLFVLTFLSISAESRIRMRKVKEAPRVCKVMQEDPMLSRDGKKVLGTLRHSLIFENGDVSGTVTLVKDKGEMVCQWPLQDWNQVLKKNTVENLVSIKYHIDEFKDLLIPYAQKADGSYFIWTIAFASCSLEDVKLIEKLDLPACQSTKKRSKKKKKK